MLRQSTYELWKNAKKSSWVLQLSQCQLFTGSRFRATKKEAPIWPESCEVKVRNQLAFTEGSTPDEEICFSAERFLLIYTKYHSGSGMRKIFLRQKRWPGVSMQITSWSSYQLLWFVRISRPVKSTMRLNWS